jgi:hypothetical protein
MSGGSSSKQESSNRTVTTTNTSTVQGIEEGGMVAGGNITTIDAGTVDLARLAIESSLAGLIGGQGQALDAIQDNARGAAQLVGGSITAMAKSQEDALSFGRSAFDFGQYSFDGSLAAIQDNAKGAAQLVGGSITAMAKGQEDALSFGRSAFDFGAGVLETVESTQTEALAFANETIAESLASYGNTALSMSKATSSDTTQILNNALKYGGIGIATLAVIFAISGVIKK